MSATVTLSEIEAQYESEWVLVGDPELDGDSQLIRGKVLFHSKNRDEVDRKDMELHPATAAIIFTGQIAENAAVVL